MQESIDKQPIRILVVEDDISISRLINMSLPRLEVPYVFTTVHSAEEGLKLWEQQPFHLLLTDYSLPGMHGLEFIATLKVQFPTVPMVLFTAYDSPKLAHDAEQIGVAAYLAKPFLMDDMITIVRQLLDC